MWSRACILSCSCRILFHWLKLGILYKILIEVPQQPKHVHPFLSPKPKAEKDHNGKPEVLNPKVLNPNCRHQRSLAVWMAAPMVPSDFESSGSCLNHVLPIPTGTLLLLFTGFTRRPQDTGHEGAAEGPRLDFDVDSSENASLKMMALMMRTSSTRADPLSHLCQSRR